MRTVSQILLCIPLIVTSVSYAAGIQIGRTRLVYNAEKKEIALPITNKEQELPWLVQSWTDTGDGKTRGPFIVTPPLFRLDPQKEQSLRIAWNGMPLPTDRESLFYMNVRTIPGADKVDEGKNMLRLNYKTRLKLFFRPRDLPGSAEETCQKLRFTRRGDQLTVINDGAFHSVFDSLQLGNSKLEKADMVAPHARADIPLPKNAQGNSVSWRCITDYGNASDKHTTMLTQG
ncbi:molecular chaperone [Kluyvera sp. STS39-E]|uniref:molecular chaperone n=1 Tax=Kluyvera sp. STS39-E TaxID=3234748 RepID=UPI0034C66582